MGKHLNGVSRFDSCLHSKTGLWCNGNTTDFGSVIMGSSPVGPTKYVVTWEKQLDTKECYGTDVQK